VADAEHGMSEELAEFTVRVPVDMTPGTLRPGNEPWSGGLDRIGPTLTGRLATVPVTSTLYDEAAHVVQPGGGGGPEAAPALATERMAGVAQTTAPPTAALLRKVRRP
jgi:hypothetical protein